MPVFQPPQRPDEIAVEKLDVLGYRERGHLSHVGFAWEFAEVSRDNEVAVVDGRPVRRDHDKLPVHVIGRVRLGRRERMLMTSWLERHLRARLLVGDYIHVDHVDHVARDRNSGRIIGRRMSGALLVHECLRSCTDLTLVDLADLPMTERSRLSELWGERAIQMSAYRDELPGDGPWAILLPAHILHALARSNPRASALHPTSAQWDFT
jgi:hypothetical protein